MTKLILIGSILAVSYPAFAEQITDGPTNPTVADKCVTHPNPLKCYIETRGMQSTPQSIPGLFFNHGIEPRINNELTNGDINKFFDPEAVKNNTLNQIDRMQTGKQ